MEEIKPVISISDIDADDIAFLTEESIENLHSFFAQNTPGKSITVNILKAQIPGIGVVTDYTAPLTGRYYQDGDLFVTTAHGFLNVSSMTRRLSDLVQSYVDTEVDRLGEGL